MKITTSSSAGSTQNRVLARPPQKKLPWEAGLPETDPLVLGFAEIAHGDGGQVHTPGQVIGGHVFQGPGADHPLAVEGAATEQHLAEAVIIADGGHQAATA